MTKDELRSLPLEELHTRGIAATVRLLEPDLSYAEKLELTLLQDQLATEIALRMTSQATGVPIEIVEKLMEKGEL